MLFLSDLEVSAHTTIQDGNARMNNDYSPFEVQKRSWNDRWKNKGSKDNETYSGNKLVYDIYSGQSSSSLKMDWRIANSSKWGEKQPFLQFWGWSALFGHHHHDQKNQATYILAVNNQTNEEKMYKVEMSNLNATKDIEYNSQSTSPGNIWNKCGASVKNKSNLECNMAYEWVGFKAWIPLNELFPDGTINASWRLYIVKNVENHVVYDELRLPFNMRDLNHNNGKVSMSSGLNANNLIMIGSPVIKRTSPRSNESGWNVGYFTEGKTYNRVNQNEQNSTAIWYGVRDGGTRWASSVYWGFGGDQAVLSYERNTKKCPDGSTVYVGEACTVEVTIYHKDINTDKNLDIEKKKATVGKEYSFSPKKKGAFKDSQGRPYVSVSDTKKGKTPNNNMTFTFYYNNLKECPDGVKVGLDEDCQVDVTIHHVDAINGDTLDTEMKKATVGQNYTFKAKKNGTYADPDGNPYISVPENQTKSGKTPDDNFSIIFNYKASIPDPSESKELENTTKGMSSGQAFWELRRINLDDASKVVVKIDFDLTGEHYAIRNEEHKLKVGNYNESSNEGSISQTLVANAVKNSEMLFDYKYDYTNYYKEIYKCVDFQGNDCFLWEFDKYEPDWSKAESYSLTSELGDDDYVKLNVDHRQGEIISKNSIDEILEEEILVGRSLSVEENDSKKKAYYETWDKLTNDMKNNYELKTQTTMPIKPDKMQYKVEVPSGEHENADYKVLRKGNSSGFYYPVDVDDSLKQEYENTTDDSENLYAFPLQQMELKRMGNGEYQWEYTSDYFFMTPNTGFIVGYPRTLNIKDNLLYGSSLPSFNEIITSADNKLKRAYKEATDQDVAESIMFAENTEENRERWQRYSIPISPESELEPNTIYTNNIMLDNMGLSDITFKYNVNFSFGHYLFGSINDEAWIIEQQDPRITMENVTVDEVNRIVLKNEDMPVLVELIKNRPTEKMHKFRTTDADFVEKLKGIVGDWNE